MARINYLGKAPRKRGGTLATVTGRGSKQKAYSVMKRLNNVRSTNMKANLYGVQKGASSKSSRGSRKIVKRGVFYRIYKR